jgi:hypothetical protein
MPTTSIVDWRQIERWGIDERSIPPDTLVQFRAPGFWDQYRTPALTAIAVFVLQSALVTFLLIEHRRRRWRRAPRTSIVSSWLMLHDWLSRAN